MWPFRVPERCIARGGLADAEAIAHLHARADPPGWNLAGWQAHLAQAGVMCLVCRTGEQLHGFIALTVAVDEADILMIAVDPSRRREGLAGALLTSALEALANRGVARVVLEVAADNAAAEALYAGHGFNRIAKRSNYYARATGHMDALVMALDMAAGDGGQS